MNAVTAILVLIAALNTVLLILIWRARSAAAGSQTLDGTLRDEFARNRQESADHARQLREELAVAVAKSGNAIVDRVQAVKDSNEARLGEFRTTVEDRVTAIAADARRENATLRQEALTTLETMSKQLTTRLDALNQTVSAFSERNESRLEAVRATVDIRLAKMQEENAAQLEQMRQTVDEKLQSTLEQRLGESFRLVSERLEAVSRGLGEMQTLASGVGDLKRVLTNVKTRGTWGEVQLGNLLDQMLTPEQYSANVAVKPGSAERVEFAIKLPGRGADDGPVWLPIDAKFPQEDYQRLTEAQENADAEGVATAGQALESRILAEARKIREKYVDPPHTTDFAILFLPTEGLYAEVLRRPGMDDKIHRERVMLAGPTNLAAILNSLQMGFRTLAIEKRSSEVWSVLGAVKTEFGKFGGVLSKVQDKLHQASQTIEEAQKRSRVMTRRLSEVEGLPGDEAQKMLPGIAIVPDEEEEAHGAAAGK